MKITELTIGDWVHYSMNLGKDGVYEKDMQIINMYGNDINCKVQDYEIISGHWIDNCTPIPLTEEILKANGFKKLELTIGNYALFLKEEGKYDIRSILWGGIFDGRIDIEVIDNYVCVRKRFRYVHELQGALRCCGLWDLANNFKLTSE